MASSRSIANLQKRNRQLLRRLLVEGLERRELMAADSAAPIFAAGSTDAYIRTWIDRLAQGTANVGGGSLVFAAAAAAPINLSGDRWTNPTGGFSPNEGDPSVISWGFVPDGTSFGAGVSIANPASTSNLIAFMDGIYGTSAGPISTRPWFPLFTEAYDRWARVSGLTFVYEANDDGALMDNANRGLSGVRADMRIGGQVIDADGVPGGNILAFNFFPNSGGVSGLDGDMVLDTGDSFYQQNAGGDNRGLLNVLSHEIGHGLGLGHVIPSNGTKLMEPILSFAFSGPQHDDVLGVQTLYGDDNEQVGDPIVDLGLIANGRRSVSQVSIDRNSDVDEYRFSTLSAGRLTIQLAPFGLQYLVGPENGIAAQVDTTLNKDLSFELLDASGSVLLTISNTGLGQRESLQSFPVPGQGNYRLRVRGGAGETQLYTLDLVASGFINSGVGVLPPRLLSVSSNSGQTFDPNAGNAASSNVLNEAPRELIFRFSGSQQLDPSSLNGIRIIRAGGDGTFASGNEVVLTPSYLGFGDSDRIIVARFGEALPDDRYRIEVLGTSDYGLPAVQSLDEQLLVPRFPNTDRDTYFFNLDLGAKVLAVVPQPVTRLSNGTLSQARNQIEVYFNDDDLTKSIAESTSFYKLILSQETANSNDDILFEPTSVFYDAALDKATLTFSAPIDLLPGVNGSGTFRLRIGSNRPLALAPTSTNVEASVDVGDTLNSASNALGNLAGQASFLLSANAIVSTTNRLDPAIQFPGGNDEPGHRDILNENHLLAGADASTSITRYLYSFSEGQSYGLGSNGQPLFTSITSDQKARIREIFEFYSAQAGIDFVEVADASLANFSIVVGDLYPLNNPPQPFTPAGIAGGGLAIMNGALNWNNGLGESFFDVSLHEIGHLLGIGHSYELPSGTVMGSTGQLNSGNPIEFFFPGNHDIAHLQYMHRPDNRDVDIYRFNVPVGQRGTVVAETIAERLANSSNLDTYLTLFKRDASGLHILAVNDNYFSDDSLIRAEIVGEVGAEYFIAVTSRGNESFDPKVSNSGGGGVSQGQYQLRFDYRPSDSAQILDIEGTPLDGNGDGTPGGEFNFWFRAASPIGEAAIGAPKTIFVDKDNTLPAPNGSLANPFRSVQEAMAAANTQGDVVRFIGSAGLDRNLASVADNIPYEFGNGGPSKGDLPDGANLVVPKGTTLMIDAGAILKFGASQVVVGSSDASQDQSGAALQVLGIPSQNVFFTSHFDQSLGVDTNLLVTTPQKGDWGGIEIRNDIDRLQGRREPERDGVFLNYIGNATLSYGGGSVSNGTQSRVVNPIHLNAARPTLAYNRIERSADAGLSADPNSFEETRFTETRYQFSGVFTPDYERVGPVILGQKITDSSINGLFIRIDTLAGQSTQGLEVSARLDDADIVYVLGDNLLIHGTPGGSLLETVRPDLTLSTLNATAGGTLPTDTSFRYRLSYVDRFGNEGLVSNSITAPSTTASNRTVVLNNLPAATGDFVGRRLYRSRVSGTQWDLVGELDRSAPGFTDRGRSLATAITLSNLGQIQRARPDASLVVDPGVVIKAFGSRIEVGIGAQLIAEGLPSKPVIFTSRSDDRFGAGATFDTNNDQANGTPAPGDWSGIVARHLSSLSLDSARVTFAGGNSSISGGFATFNAVEIHQASARITNSILEDNDRGNANPARPSNRDYRGQNDDSVIFVTASQPIIANNIIRNNQSAAAISIDADAMKAISIDDSGRSTGTNSRVLGRSGNLGPLILGNRLGGNEVNGMRIRGATLTTETVWDDTDIVHVLESQIVVPDFHSYGGLRLQSRGDESLVVKLSGANAGLTASGRPLDIPTRIGGSLQIIGAPGYPVVMTSLSDDTIGAGYDSLGNPMLDTNNDGTSVGVVGDWRSIRLDAYSNDRNVDTTFELESDNVADNNRNDLPNGSQGLGSLANNVNGGDENVRLGFTVFGVLGALSDLDVYQFRGRAGTSVWIDIDRTSAALDSVVELIDPAGNILAQSNNSFAEATAGSVFAGSSSQGPVQAFPMGQSAFVSATSDFQTVNPLDAGLRLVLPGTLGTENTYYVRVRSSNMGPTDSSTRLQNLSLVKSGLTSGPYRLQIRLQQEDEIGGSTIRYSDIRFAQTGIEVLGLPGHSPLLSETSEDPTNPDETNAQNLGNIANTDRAAVSVAGQISGLNDVDWYRFRIYRDSIQTPGNLPISTVLDIDYADGLGRPDTTLWVFQLDNTGNNPRLVLIGTDSNVGDDRGLAGDPTNQNDLTRGSSGPRDPFIGAQELTDGEYIVAVTHASRVEEQLRQYTLASPANSLLRLEPITSIDRISEDTFGNLNNPVIAPVVPAPVVAKQVSFDASSAVPYSLADVTLFVASANGNETKLLYANAFTGVREAELADALDFNASNDIAVSPAGVVASAEPPLPGATRNDAGLGFISRLNHDGSAQARINAGIQTFEAYPNATAGQPAQVTQAQTPPGTATNGVGTEFTALTFAYDPSSPVGTNSLALFAIGQRGDRQPFNSANITGNNTVVGPPVPGDVVATAYRNILYRLDPNTFTAISPPQAANRTGNYTSRGTGTNVREYGVFAETSTYIWDRNNTGTGDNIVVTRQAAGDIVGLAQIGSVLYGITNQGELWSLPIGNFNQGFQTGATLITDTLPVGLTGMSAGPRNVEGGIYANMLFATTSNGTLYAFDTLGAPQGVFPGGASNFRTTSADNLGNVSGIDFAALDVNLWHVTGRRAADPGHGRPTTLDASRFAAQNGGNSLYFGFEPTGGNPINGSWDRSYRFAATTGTYDLAGGAKGAVESNPIDLRTYSVEDKPTLYFNYRADTQATNGPFNDDNPMLDALRVYGIGEDGVARLLATNNNTDDLNYSNAFNEFDPVNALNVDAYGKAHRPQQLFDVTESGNSNGWRQARIPLAAMAGQNNVRLRIEFSTGGSFESGDILLGGQEMVVKRGGLLNDGETFVVAGPGPTGANITRTFELDLGLVLNLPSGASIQPGSQITVQGRVFTFVTGTPGVREIRFSATDSPRTIATAVRNALQADGFSVFVNSIRPNTLNVQSGTRAVTPTGVHTVSGLDQAIIEGYPGIGGGAGRVAVPIDQSMDEVAVRDAIRTALANTFNIASPLPNLIPWKFYGNVLKFYNYTVTNSGPFVLHSPRLGDEFGAKDPVSGGSSRLVQASLRATENAFEGIYIDDIIIAMAERGEVVVGAIPSTTPTFQVDTLLSDGAYPDVTTKLPTSTSIPAGAYQLEIRSAASYLQFADDQAALLRNFDSNDRLTRQASLIVNNGSAFADGATFTLSDGTATVTFEFDVTTSVADPAFGVTQGRIALAISPDMTAQEIATRIRNAINSPSVQSILKIRAGLTGEMSNGAGGYLFSNHSAAIQLFGTAAVNVRGSTATGLAGISMVLDGTDSGYGEDFGDSNRRRDQGQLVIASNTVRDSQRYGILVDSAARDQSNLAQFVGPRPYPGSVRNLITINNQDLAPGVVVANNIVAFNATGGIFISGDNTTNVPQAATHIARVYNNTVYGNINGDVGIRIEEGATATVLNNIIAHTTFGIDRSGAGNNTVLGANLFQSNVTNVIGGGTNTFPIGLLPTDPLFIDITNYRFYLAPQSRAIDSSLASLNELGLLSQVKNSVGLPPSPLIAPPRDTFGVSRVDDLSVNTPSGQGQNVNIDRGAVERADSQRIKAVLLNPLDNDAAGSDADPNTTYVQLLQGSLDFFSILLNDEFGSGPDENTVLADSVIITENGRTLVPNVDYTFGYSPASKTIRLTPLSGLWRSDSVYEISLINAPTFRIDTLNGASLADGDSIVLTLASGATRTLEFEAGFVVNVPSALTPQTANGQTLVYQLAGGGLRTFEFNLVGDPVVGSNTIIDLLPSDDYLAITSKLTTALAAYVTGGSFPVSDLGQGRIHVGGVPGDDITVSNSFLGVTGRPGVAGSLRLQVPFTGGATFVDGDTFSITNLSGVPVTFEFDNNLSTTGGNIPITFALTDTAFVLANRIANAIGAAGLGLTPSTQFGTIVLNESSNTIVNLGSSKLTSTGSPGGAIAIPFIPSNTFTSVDLAARLLPTLNQIGQGVHASMVGYDTILIRGLTAISGVAASTPSAIRDIAGNYLDPNRSNAFTQFTIVMPTVQLDYGDAAIRSLLVDNGARHAKLPADAPQFILGVNLDFESNGAPSLNALGDDAGIVDDEDGVVMTSTFNNRAASASIEVDVTGRGFIDAWIDWNRDGDFDDVGEQVLTNQQVSTGRKQLSFAMSSTAEVGLSYLRVRASSFGNLTSSGVAIGGEVEDYAIQLISNFWPVANNDTFATTEDTTLVVPAAGILGNDTDADAGTTLTVVDSDPNLIGIQPSVAPTSGSLTLNADGSFSYTPSANATGTDTFVYFISDGSLTSLSPATVTIQVAAINDAPVFTIPTAIDIDEDQGSIVDTAGGQTQVPITVVSFATNAQAGPSGAADENSQALSFQVVASQPSFFEVQPTLVQNANNASQWDLVFTLAKNVNRNFANGLNNEITVTLVDNGSNVSPNVNTSATKTFSINILPVNDPPISDSLTVNGTEDTAILIPASTIFANDLPGPSSATDEASQTIALTSFASSSAQGGTVVPIMNGNVIESILYTPKANFAGIDTLTYTLVDSGNPSMSGSGTLTINLASVNDAPTFNVISTVTVTEDQGSIFDSLGNQTQVPISIPGFITNINPGPAGTSDEANQAIFIDVVALQPGFFEVQPTIALDPIDPTRGILTFTLAKHRNNAFPQGLNNLVRVTFSDNGSSVFPNSNTSQGVTFSVDITPVNDPPLAGNFHPNVLEDSSTTFSAAELLATASPASPGEVDEVTQVLRIVQMDQQTAQNGIVGLVFSGNSVASFRYVPPPNFVGQDTFTYQIADNGVPSQSVFGTVTVTVSGVNDAPTFTPGGTVSVAEDSGAFSGKWATNVLAGPAGSNEVSGPNAQTVQFQVTSAHASLFSVFPSIASNGVLSFTPAPNASGTAILSVVATDSGNDVLPNVNRSVITTLTIDIAAVNDPPVFSSGGNVTVNEDSGSVNLDWATNILAAAGLGLTPVQSMDENAQAVSFIVTSNSNPGLFVVGPSVAVDGKLSFTTTNHANGSAVVTVIAVDDGASQAPSNNRSPEITFTINLQSVNDPPSGVNDTYSTNEDSLFTQTAGQGLLGNDSDVDAGDTFSAVSASITSTQGAAVSINADGSFTYDPSNALTLQALGVGQSATDTFTYLLRDASGSESAPVTVTMLVAGANDAPDAVDDIFSVAPDTTQVLDVLANDRDIDSSLVPGSLEVGLNPSNGTVSVSSNGVVSYTPNAGFRGTDSFGYRVRDTNGVLSNEAIVTIRINRPPVAQRDNANVLAGQSIDIDVVANDTDADGNSTIVPSSLTIISLPSFGSATIQSNGKIRYLAPAGSSGATSFTYTIADSSGAISLPGTVSINVVGSLFQNPSNRFDVNADGAVSPVDALIIINDLNRNGSRPLSPTSFTPPPYLDVNGSGSVEPTDVLGVINFLNRRASAGEGEGSSVVYAVPPVQMAGTSSTMVTMVSPLQIIHSIGPALVTEIRQALAASALADEAWSSIPDEVSTSASSKESLSSKHSLVDALFEDEDDEAWTLDESLSNSRKS